MNLFPYQQKVLDQTADYQNVAYYLDMGLGKTFIGSEKMHQIGNGVNVVICQKSKIEDWMVHFARYYSYSVYDLTNKAMADSFNNAGDIPRVGVINYELAFRRPWLKNLKHFTLLLDESSLISNENAKRSRFVLSLHPDNVILLSGTPTAGKYERLWSQCRLLGWNISKEAFYNSYIVTDWYESWGGFHKEIVTGYKNVDHLKQKLAEHGVVFMKTAEASIDLPDQIEQRIMLKPTSEYKNFIKTGYIAIDGKELVGDNTLTKMLYARQLCGIFHKEKYEALHDLAESTEDRLIIFYNFTEELIRMQECLKDLNRPYSLLNGSVKSLSAYESYSDSITFIQYQAGAMGGNFQKANKIIYFTLPLGKGSCDLWEQSKKRIHRIGQEKTCFYYYLLVQNSIEMTNLESLKKGKDLTDELFKKNIQTCNC